MAERVVITSTGVISSLGFTPEKIITNLKEKNVVFERPAFDSETAICPIQGFNLKEFTGRYKDARYLNRGVQFAVAAAMETLRNSGLAKSDIEHAGLFVGSGPNFDISGEFSGLSDNRIHEEGLPALWILKFLPNTAASSIARLTGIHGENVTTGSACAASMMAIGEAFRKIKDGYLELALAGGGDSRLNPGGIMAYKKAQALWSGHGDPVKEYIPFGQNRTGFIAGEGGAFFLLENLRHAKKRGAEILAEICGFGTTIDGYNMTAPRPDGKWAARAITNALKEAKTPPSDVDLISAHGTGTLLNDSMEANLIHRLFTSSRPHIMALKSWVGHLASSCGAMELGICLACLASDYWPEIRNLTTPCNKDVRFLSTPMPETPSTLLLENFGFGGQNSALIIKKWNE